MPAQPHAVIAITYGEPTANRFSDQWMYSYRILQRLTRKIARIPGPLLPVIATKRAFERVAAWREHDFTSPLEPLTEQTAAALAAELERRGAPTRVEIAYEFRRPLLPEVVSRLRGEGVERFTILPMYSGTGDFTDGMTELALEDTRRKHPDLTADALSVCLLTPDPTWIERLAQVCADFVIQQLTERGLALPAKDWAMCLGAHGSVQTCRDDVDNGVASFGALCWGIYSRLRGQVGVARNGWLNHERGGRWTEPAVDRVLERLRAMGYTKLIYFPWGFTTDNAESALEGKLFIEEMEDGFDEVIYLPCLNDAPPLIAMLADRLLDHQAAAQGATAEPASAVA